MIENAKAIEYLLRRVAPEYGLEPASGERFLVRAGAHTERLVYEARARNGKVVVREELPEGVMATTSTALEIVHASLLFAAERAGATTTRTQGVAIAGSFRIYFNRHGAAPLVWCVANGHIEIAVARVELTAPTRTVYAPKDTPDHEDGKPSAWLEAEGRLTIIGNVATIAGLAA